MVVVGATAVLPPDQVSAIAEAVGAAATTAVLLRGGREKDGVTLS
ncbi:hypothetical protein ACN2WE_40880 [Streptomyces sp. cg28]